MQKILFVLQHALLCSWKSALENGWVKGWISRCCPHHVDSPAFMISATFRSESQVLHTALLNACRRFKQWPDIWEPKIVRNALKQQSHGAETAAEDRHGWMGRVGDAQVKWRS